MMPLDSWIDEEAREWMRQLAPAGQQPNPAEMPDDSLAQAFLLPENPTRAATKHPAPSIPEKPKITPPSDDSESPERIRLREKLAALRQRALQSGLLQPDTPTPILHETTGRDAPSVPPTGEPEILPPPETVPTSPLDLTKQQTENEAAIPQGVRSNLRNHYPEPRSLRQRLEHLTACLDAEVGVREAIIFNHKGLPLHSIGSTDPNLLATLHNLATAFFPTEERSTGGLAITSTPIHTEWNGRLFVLLPVPHSLGTLFLAGQVGEPLSPESCKLLAHSVRKVARI